MQQLRTGWVHEQARSWQALTLLQARSHRNPYHRLARGRPCQSPYDGHSKAQRQEVVDDELADPGTHCLPVDGLPDEGHTAAAVAAKPATCHSAGKTISFAYCPRSGNKFCRRARGMAVAKTAAQKLQRCGQKRMQRDVPFWKTRKVSPERDATLSGPRAAQCLARTVPATFAGTRAPAHTCAAAGLLSGKG